jgi:hypothetical protein
VENEGNGLLRGSHLVAEVLAEELGKAVGAVAGQYFDLPAELVAELVADEGLAAGGLRSTEIQEVE